MESRTLTIDVGAVGRTGAARVLRALADELDAPAKDAPQATSGELRLDGSVVGSWRIERVP